MSGTVFVDTVTGELKYQGTTSTPGILADSSGNVPFMPIKLNNTIVSNVTQIDSATFTSIGTLIFDPSTIFDGNDKITRTIQLKTLLHASTGVTTEIKLYNVTLAADVTSTTSSSTDTSPTEYISTLTVGGNIANSAAIYELQLRISFPVIPSPGDYAFCSFGSVVVTYA